MRNRWYYENSLSLGVFLAVFLCIFLPAWSGAAEVFQSGGQRVQVLELYTSEGCSSCPPADRWFSTLKQDDRLWRQLVPIAFHVDYWNYIGWEDPFSSPAYSERQRQYARGTGLSTVYTPGFLLNGREWSSFFGLRHLSLDPAPGAGSLTVSLDQQILQATWHAVGQSLTTPVLNIAVLGFDLVTRVEAGENRGRHLKHDFVVLGHKITPLSARGDSYVVTTELPPVSIRAPRHGIAVWINNEGDLTPLQATGGWIQQ